MKLIILVIICISSMFCCTQFTGNIFITEGEGNVFDKETYDLKYQEWKESGISSYSFTYIRSRSQNPDCDEIGNVTVENGISSVIFSLPEGLTGLSEEQILSMTDYTYPSEEDAFKSIDEVYENIYKAYLNDTENELILYTEYSISYDDLYPIPVQAKENSTYKESEWNGWSSYELTITNFSVN